MKLSTLVLVAALAGAPLAYAQAPDDGGGPPAAGQGGPGGQPPSPQQRAARRAAMQAMQQACQADMQTLCAGQSGRDAMMCMRQNRDKVSQGCKDAMAKMRGRGGFGRRGPPGGPPPAPPAN